MDAPEPDAAWSRLVALAAARYRPVDGHAHRFARAKLRHDTVFRHLIEHGLVAPGDTVLDLGCGQGLVASLLCAAHELAREGGWPGAWPAPPGPLHFTGIDLRGRDIARARAALGGAAVFVAGDMRELPFPPGDLLLFVDTLHYLDRAAQDAVLRKASEALRPGGALLLRVHDAAAPWRYRFGLAVDRATMALRGGGFGRLSGRPLAQWAASLAALGLQVQARTMNGRAPFANQLIVARRPSAAR